MVITVSPQFIALSLGLIMLALAFIMPSLWKSARRSAIVFLLVLPILSISVYFWIGQPAALNANNRRAPETIDEAIAQLERRLIDQPDNIDGWLLLGRSQKAQARAAEESSAQAQAAAQYQAAEKAFARAHALAKNDPDITVEYVEARSLANLQRQFDAQSLVLLDQVIAANPRHQRGLWFRGIAAMQQGDFKLAAKNWETLLPIIDEATRTALLPQITNARQQAGLPPLEALASTTAGPVLAVTVTIDQNLRNKLRGNETLFVFARSVDQQGPPVAAARVPAEKFPITITLSDANSVMPTRKLSEQSQVTIFARLSSSGDAGAKSGDLQAASVNADIVDGKKITLNIDTLIP